MRAHGSNSPAKLHAVNDDHSIPVQTTIANLQSLSEGHPAFAWRTYDGLDHSLSPGVWDDVAGWLATLPTFRGQIPSKHQ